MAKPNIPEFKVIIDSREQLPYEFFTETRKKDPVTKRVVEVVRHDWRTEVRKLDTGDYSIEGFENIFTIERKSLSDFMGCVFTDRFDNEMFRMAEILHPYLLIEADYEQVTNPQYNRSQAQPNSVIGKLASYGMKHNVQILLLGNRQNGNLYAKALCRLFYEKFNKGELHSMRIGG